MTKDRPTEPLVFDSDAAPTHVTNRAMVATRPRCMIKAKFHYTDPTRTRTDPHGLFLRLNSVGSVRVWTGPCSGIELVLDNVRGLCSCPVCVGSVSGPCSGI